MAAGAVFYFFAARLFPALIYGGGLVGLILVGRGLQTVDSIWHRKRERSPDLLVGGILLLGVSAVVLALDYARLDTPSSVLGSKQSVDSSTIGAPPKSWP